MLVLTSGMRKNGNFEVHIASEGSSPELEQLFRGKFQKFKYFLNVYDVPATAIELATHGVPPTGHDLAAPLFMATSYVASLQEAQTLVSKGMEYLDKHNVKGNFEIERVIADQIQDCHDDPLKGTLEQYHRVPDSPAYENHVGWKAPLTALPSYENVIGQVHNCIGRKPNQIVDFSTYRDPNPGDNISRVATIYQPTRELALQTGELLKRMDARNPVSEQVLVVGE